MKVFHITNRKDGCFYVRALMPSVNNGYDCDRLSLRSERIPAELSMKLAMRSDIIVFHRPDSEDAIGLASMMKKLGKKIVFDNDDTYRLDQDMIFSEQIQKRQDTINSFVKMADLVTTTTQCLADEYRAVNDKVVVLPNCIDPSDWPTPIKNETKLVRIGIFGSATCNDDWEIIRDYLKELGNDERVQLVMFGLPASQDRTKLVRDLYKTEISFWDTVNIEWHSLVQMYDYIRTLRSLKLDIVIIPRKDNYFNRCKSNLKFLESSMLEIPVVAQSFSDKLSPYQNDKDYLLMAQTESDWHKQVESLIIDKEKRLELGKRAKEYVLENYNIINKASLWESAYKSIYEN